VVGPYLILEEVLHRVRGGHKHLTGLDVMGIGFILSMNGGNEDANYMAYVGQPAGTISYAEGRQEIKKSTGSSGVEWSLVKADGRWVDPLQKRLSTT